MRELGTARSYDDLHSILRARVEELNVSRLTLDAVSGTASGYCSKILAPSQVKRLGAISLPSILGALGLCLVVCEDPEALERVKSRLVQRRQPGVKRSP